MVVCPFKGLAFFDVEDADYFCGREQLVADLVSRLAAGTLAGLVGPSGSGKSSLLRAGLLSRLGAGILPGSDRWRVALLRPGPHPAAELRRVLGPGDFLAALGPGERLVLAVDQLEELFTACDDERERAEFLDALVAAADDGERRAKVLVALRADFYGRCAAHPRFAALLSRNHALVGPMDRDELARAIELPASRAGLQVERSLVDALVADVAGRPGALPLLSTALLELWRLRDGRVLQSSAYRRSGGVQGAVARLAEDAFERFGPQEQQVARTVLLRLAGDEDGAAVRRRARLAELDTIAGSRRVLATLTDARLLTVDDGAVEISHEALLREWPRLRGWLEEDRAGRQVHAHLSASAGAWAAGGRDRGDLYRGARLSAALEWTSDHAAELNAAERAFLDASRAESERELRSQRAHNRRLRALLAGVAALLVVAVAAGALALVKRHSAQVAARAALARQLGAEAIVEPRIDRAMLLAREAVRLDRSTQTEGTLLATLLRSPAALATFTLPIQARPQRVTLSPDGRTLAVADNIGTVRLYDTRSRRPARAPLTDRGYGPATYSPDGSLLVAPGAGPVPVLDVFDARTYARVAQLKLDRRYATRPTLPIDITLVAPDAGSVLFAYTLESPEGGPGAAYLDRWSLPGGRLVSTTRLGRGGALAARLLDGGTRLAVLGEGRIAILDAGTLRPLRSVPIAPLGAPLHAAAISPDGRRAALGLATGSVAFADLRTGAVTPAAGGHSAFVQSAGFSPDGRVVVTTGDDARVIVWDPATAQPRETLSGHAGRVLGQTFSNDGRTLYTCSLDGAILEWDLGGDRRFGEPFRTTAHPATFTPDTPLAPPLAMAPGGAHFAAAVGASEVGIFTASRLRLERSFALDGSAGAITALAWSPAGGQLVVGGHAGTVQLWDVRARPRLVRSLSGLRSANGLPEAIQAVAFGAGGDLVAAVDINHTPGSTPPDGRLAIWDARSGRPIAPPVALHRQGWSVAFSEDGELLAAGLDDDRVLLVGARDARIRRTLRPAGAPITSLAFAPGGTLVTGSWAGIVQRWDVATGTRAGHPVLVTPSPVASLAFGSGGDTYATTGGSDGTAKLWTTATGRQLGTTFEGRPGHWGTAAYAAGGTRLIVVYDDGTGFAWPVAAADWERHACAVAGRNLTREEWTRFVTDRDYEQICP